MKRGFCLSGRKTELRCLAWVMVMFILLTILGMNSYASAVVPDIYIAGDRIDINTDSSGDGWSYSAANRTLTLNNCNLNYENTGSGAVISYNGNEALTIELKGTNKLTRQLSGTPYGDSYQIRGIFIASALTITGNGSLICECSDNNSSNISQSVGIEAPSSLTIDGGKITATGGAAGGADGGGASYGISAANSLTINNGTVTATGGKSRTSQGINTGLLDIKAGRVTAQGGEAINTSTGVSGPVTVRGGKLTATGGEGKNGSYGIHSDNSNISISGGIVEAAGGTADNNSIGICLNTSRLTIENGITSMKAAGNNNAIVGTVVTAIAGSGWTNTAGTTGETAIAASTSPLDLSPYKKVQFPATPTTYTVTVTNDGHGTASADVASGAEGTEVTLTATPSEGYRFKEWLVVSGAVTVTDNKFTIGTANVEVKAIFELIPTYTVTVTNDGHGTASADIASGAEGTEVTLTATPSEGYRFKEWQVVSGGITVTNNKFTIGTANVEVKAVFELVTAEYTLFSVTGTTEGESHTWTKGNTNDVDMTVKLNGTVDNSYAHFTGVQLGGTKLTKGTDYDAHEGSTVVTLKAAMLEKLSVGAYTVSILFDDGQVDTTLTIKAAATPTATATPTAAPTPSPTPAPTSTPRPVPKTGDSDHPVLWIGLILLGIAGLAALAAIKVSRKRK